MHALTSLKCSFPESGGFGGSEVYMGEISSKVFDSTAEIRKRN